MGLNKQNIIKDLPWQRLFRGEGATPARIRALDIRAEKGTNFL